MRLPGHDVRLAATLACLVGFGAALGAGTPAAGAASSDDPSVVLHEDAPEPGQWRSRATLQMRMPITQKHVGVLSLRDRCAREVLFDLGDGRHLILARSKAGKPLTGSRQVQGCTSGQTNWSLDVAAPGRLEGQYVGSCDGRRIQAAVVMQRLGKHPDAQWPAARPEGGEKPDIYQPDTPAAVDTATLYRRGQAALERLKGRPIANFGDYAWYDHSRFGAGLMFWITSDGRLRRDTEALPDECEVDVGTLEPARHLLFFRVEGQDGGGRKVLARFVDVETGIIEQAADIDIGDSPEALADGIETVVAELRHRGASFVLEGAPR